MADWSKISEQSGCLCQAIGCCDAHNEQIAKENAIRNKKSVFDHWKSLRTPIKIGIVLGLISGGYLVYKKVKK
jgi:hypothetical protein